jgi:drug/metabolite transporter (DMT)-like permease
MVAGFLALLSSLMWGSADFLGGTLTRKRPAFAVAGAAQIVGLVFMVVVAAVTSAWSETGLGYLPWAVLASITGLGGLVAFYQALATGRMAIVSPIASLGVIVPLAVGLRLGDQPSGVQYAGIALALVGIVLATGPEIEGAVGLKPVLLAGLAALLFGLVFTFIALGSQTNVIMTITTQRVVSAVIVLVVAVVARSIGGLQRADVPILLAVGLLDVGANLTYGIATTLGLLVLVAVLGSLFPVVTAVLAWLFQGERLRPIQYLGVALALLGVAAISAG